MPGYCSVLVSKETQRKLEPRLRGPCRTANGKPNNTFSQITQVSSMPFALLRASAKALDLVLSFEPPALSFKRDDNQPSLAFSLVVSKVYEIALENTVGDKPTVLIAASGEIGNTLSFTVRSKKQEVGSLLFKVDLTPLEDLSRALASEKQEIDFAANEGFTMTRVLQSQVCQHTFLSRFFFGHFEPTQLTLRLQSTKALPFDKSEAWLRQIEAKVAHKRDVVSNYEPDAICWQISDKSWLKKMERIEGATGNEDVSIESFKEFFSGLLNHYVSHYSLEQFEQLFARRLETLA